MHQTTKGTQQYFDMKAHVGGDADSELVHNRYIILQRIKGALDNDLQPSLLKTRPLRTASVNIGRHPI